MAARQATVEEHNAASFDKAAERLLSCAHEFARRNSHGFIQVRIEVRGHTAYRVLVTTEESSLCTPD